MKLSLTRIFWISVICMFVMSAAIAVSLVAERVHELSVIDYVEKNTYHITTEKGSGTAFAVKAPSGKVWLVTNAHVCELKDELGSLTINPPYGGNQRPVNRRVVEIWDENDLCLIEAPDYASEGLSVASNRPERGAGLAVVGHPLGYEEPVIARGELLSYEKVWQSVFILDDVNTRESCESKGWTVMPTLFYDICTRYSPTFKTTVKIYPGNSGSAVVNFWGEVVGVIWGANIYTNWGVAVPLNDLQRFLSPY